jgi:hypothetical protein
VEFIGKNPQLPPPFLDSVWQKRCPSGLGVGEDVERLSDLTSSGIRLTGSRGCVGNMTSQVGDNTFQLSQCAEKLDDCGSGDSVASGHTLLLSRVPCLHCLVLQDPLRLPPTGQKRSSSADQGSSQGGHEFSHAAQTNLRVQPQHGDPLRRPSTDSVTRVENRGP